MTTTIRVSPKGAARWVEEGIPGSIAPTCSARGRRAGVVHVEDRRAKFLGPGALEPQVGDPAASPRAVEAEGRRRMVARRIAACLARRDGSTPTPIGWCTAKGMASLPGGGSLRPVGGGPDPLGGARDDADDIVAALAEVLKPEGILLRNDASVRKHEGLGDQIELVHGTVPESVEVREEGRSSSPPPGAGRRPAPSSTSGTTASSPGHWRSRGGPPSTASAYHGSFARCISPLGGPRDRGGPEQGCPGAGTRERGAQRPHQHRLGRGRRLRSFVRSWGARAGSSTPSWWTPRLREEQERRAGALRGYPRDQPPRDAAPRPRRGAGHGQPLLPPPASMFLEMLAGAALRQRPAAHPRPDPGSGTGPSEIVTVPETGYSQGAVLTRVARVSARGESALPRPLIPCTLPRAGTSPTLSLLTIEGVLP